MKPQPVRTKMPVVAVTALLGLAVILLCALIGPPPTPSPAQTWPTIRASRNRRRLSCLPVDTPDRH